jgi:hypothetical protein
MKNSFRCRAPLRSTSVSADLPTPTPVGNRVRNSSTAARTNRHVAMLPSGRARLMSGSGSLSGLRSPLPSRSAGPAQAPDATLVHNSNRPLPVGSHAEAVGRCAQSRRGSDLSLLTRPVRVHGEDPT